VVDAELIDTVERASSADADDFLPLLCRLQRMVTETANWTMPIATPIAFGICNPPIPVSKQLFPTQSLTLEKTRKRSFYWNKMLER
jgi:hypothetical protein